MPEKRSITFVGLGINTVQHLTREAEMTLRQANIVLATVADPVAIEFVRELNPHIEMMNDMYVENEERHHIYDRMVAHILTTSAIHNDTCVAFYGHPGMYVYASHKVQNASNNAHVVSHMQPGISAFDCMICDLGWDPARRGVQMYESNFFLASCPRIDANTPLVIWQVGSAGITRHLRHPDLTAGIQRLLSLLLEYYAPDTQVILYRAPRTSIFPASIRFSRLDELGLQEVDKADTLVIGVKPHER